MTLKLAYNTTEGPVAVDGGYLISGGDWGVYDTSGEVASHEFSEGRLVAADEDALAASENPNALRAVADLAERRVRFEKAQALEKEQLAAVLPEETVDALEVGGDGKPAKADLVDAVVNDPNVPLADAEAAAAAEAEANKSGKKSTTSRDAAK